MKVWEVWAVILNGTVVNRLVGDQLQVSQVVANSYGSSAEIYNVSVPMRPVEIGDTFVNGQFYHNGHVVEAQPVEEEIISNLEAETIKNKQSINRHTTVIDTMSVAIDDLIIAITPTEAN